MANQQSNDKSKNRPNIPAEYKEQSSDIIGFWDSLSGDTIHMIPKGVRLLDSKIDPTKSSTLLVVELVEPISVEDPDGKSVIADKGDTIGIWTKPGMSDLKQLAGVDVYMYQQGTKEMGKGNPMYLYKVLSKTKGTKLSVLGDFRKRSLPKGQGPIPTSGDEVPLPF
jgi:hypothetical protein